MTSTSNAAATPAWRPAETCSQAGATPVDWSRTYHVDDAAGFVAGLFGLYRDVFDTFLADAGAECSIGETTLYQVAAPPQLRFEIRKLGPNEFQVRGAHFGTPSGVNICVGLNPTA